jgi:hypothetical protein
MTSKIQIGDVFSRLTVLRLIPERKNPKAECLCICGNIITPQRGALLNGRAKSCGCLRRQQNRTANLTHGASRTTEYRIFQNMKDRCSNPKNKHFKNYGGRGIKVLWASFEDFIRDMGARPHRAWIEREENDLDYGPNNCKWVSPAVNSINKRVSKFWIIDGVEFESSRAAANALGVDPSVVIRGCNGGMHSGRYYPPRPGWSCRLKYPRESVSDQLETA